MLSTRVRMAQNNFTFVYTPPSFNPNSYGTLQMWLKADAITGLNNDDPVATWNDSSGNSNNATQSSAGLRPLYKTSVLNGYPALYFDNTDDGMVTPVVLNSGTNFSIFVVYNMNPTAAGGHRVIQGIENNWLMGPYENLHKLYSVNFIDGPALTTAFVYASAINDSAPGVVYRVNGSLQGRNGDIGGPGTIVLGGSGMYNEPVQGNIVEVLAYSTKLDSTGISAVESYFATKYAL
jgi:hypothetical protein